MKSKTSEADYVINGNSQSIRGSKNNSAMFVSWAITHRAGISPLYELESVCINVGFFQLLKETVENDDSYIKKNSSAVIV